MSEWRALGLNDRLQEGDEWANKGQEDWTSVNYCHHGDKAGAWRLFDFRRRVSPVAKNATTQEARCEECNGELSQCGPQGVDGEPTLGCKYCSLKEKLVEAEQRAEKAEAVLKDPAALWVNMLRGTVPMIAEVPNLRRQLEQAEKERDEAVGLLQEHVQNYGDILAAFEERDQLRAENERLRKHLELILPMAKGYAYQNPVGNNLQMVMDAQQALAAKGESQTPVWDGPLCTHGAVPGTCGICAMQAKKRGAK